MAMTRKDRLEKTLKGETVDRPPVNFYEIGGFLVNPADSDPYNIYHAPDWQPLLRLAEEETDVIRMIKTRTTPRECTHQGALRLGVESYRQPRQWRWSADFSVPYRYRAGVLKPR